jgi:uncharacterized protein YidB (DUF937 family)
MSILNEVVTKATAMVGDKAQPAIGLLNPLIEYLHRPEIGGVPGLVQKFEKAGLGPQIQSWIGSGKQLPITPDDVIHVFGSTDISSLAAKAGIPTEQAAQQIAELLPQAVSNFAPSAKLSNTGVFGDVATKIEQQFVK